MAQTSTGTQATELAPIQVQGTASGYDVKRSASTKYTADLVDTPKSVQVIPSEVIRDQAASTLTDVLRNTPGITFGAGEGGNPLGDRPFIRGYDAQSSTYVDGLRDIGATSREVFNLEQVEVVKGSDGAYGGRGGAGGSINLISKTAKLENFSNASLGVGTDNYYRGTVDGNWQLSDSIAFRLNGMYHDADVAGRDEVNEHRWGVAPTISFGLGTPTRLSLSYYHLTTDDLPDSGIPYAYPSTWINNPANRNRPGYDPTRQLTGPADVDRNNFYGLTSDYRKTTSDMATIGFEHDFNDRLTLRNTARYTKSDQEYVWTQPDDSQGNVLNGRVWRRANTRKSDVEALANQTELVGELDTGSFKHSFNVGVELSEERGRKESINVDRGNGASCNAGVGAASAYRCTSLYAPNPQDPWVNPDDGEPAGNVARTKVATRSIYAFDTITLSERWQAGLGLRLDDYSVKYTHTDNSVRRRDDTLLNYQLGLVYKPTTNSSVYVSYATSSTPSSSDLGEGSGNSLAPGRGAAGANAADMAPEKNKTYEIGTKWDLLDDALSLTAAVFRTETTNARITLADGDYAMGGKKQVDGFELGVSGAVTPKWNIFAGYTFLKSKIKDDGVAANTGNRFPNTPENSFSLWTTYQALPDLTVGAGAYYVDKQYGDTANQTYIPSYWRFDAMAGYRFNKRLNMQLNVFNLFNKTYYNKAYPAHYANIAPGRSAILSLNLSY